MGLALLGGRRVRALAGRLVAEPFAAGLVATAASAAARDPAPLAAATSATLAAATSATVLTRTTAATVRVGLNSTSLAGLTKGIADSGATTATDVKVVPGNTPDKPSLSRLGVLDERRRPPFVGIAPRQHVRLRRRHERVVAYRCDRIVDAPAGFGVGDPQRGVEAPQVERP